MPIATEEQEQSKTIEDPPANIGNSKDNIGPTSENQQENEGKTITLLDSLKDTLKRSVYI